MATNVTASAMLDAQALLTQMFGAGQDTPSRYEYRSKVKTAEAMLMEHNANTMAVTDATGNCIGYRVYWPQVGDQTLDYNGDKTTPSLTVPCTIPSGAGPTTAAKTYTHNMALQKIVELDDDLCGNMFNVPTLIAERQAAGMLVIRKALNTKFINFLDSNKTGTNNDASLPSGITFGSSTFTVDNSVLDLQEPDTLTDLDAILLNNEVDEWFYISGRYNFYNAVVNSQYRRFNDTERDHVRFDDYSMYFDIKSLDSTLSGSNTFAVGRGTYVFWDHVDSALSQVPLQIEDNTWEFFVEDPILMVNDNGRMRPLRYHVAYQKVCNGGNTTSFRRTYTHRWEITLHGGLWVAPAGSSSETGIFKFKKA